MNNKTELRNKYKKLRKLLNIEKISDDIFKNLCKLEIFSNSENIFTYISFSDEIKTDKILKLKNKNIYTPKIIDEKMIMTKYSEKDLVKNKFGILETKNNKEFFPNKNDLMIIPALACNKNFYRLGYGGGYYDKYLQDTICIKVAIVSDAQITEEHFEKSYDIKLDYIITETTIYKNTNGVL